MSIEVVIVLPQLVRGVHLPTKESSLVVTLSLAVAIMGFPIADLQGDWQVTDWKIRPPGDVGWGGIQFGKSGPI